MMSIHHFFFYCYENTGGTGVSYRTRPEERRNLYKEERLFFEERFFLLRKWLHLEMGLTVEGKILSFEFPFKDLTYYNGGYNYSNNSSDNGSLYFEGEAVESVSLRAALIDFKNKN